LTDILFLRVGSERGWRVGIKVRDEVLREHDMTMCKRSVGNLSLLLSLSLALSLSLSLSLSRPPPSCFLSLAPSPSLALSCSLPLSLSPSLSLSLDESYVEGRQWAAAGCGRETRIWIEENDMTIGEL
jgi:hypothetical protein